MKDFHAVILTAAHTSIPRGADKTTSHTGVKSGKDFQVFINDLVSELLRGVKTALYADDLVLWRKEEYASTSNSGTTSH